MALFFVKSSKLYGVIYTLRVIGPNSDYAYTHFYLLTLITKQMAIKSIDIPSDRKQMTAKELINALSEKLATDTTCKLKNPFTSGLNFTDGEKVTFLGFNYQEWAEEGTTRHGCFAGLVLKSGEVEKTLSLTSLTKTKVGVLLDTTENPSGSVGAWSNSGGLSDVCRGLTNLDEKSLDTIAKWFKGEKTMRVRWIEHPTKGTLSLVNII